MKTGAKRSGGEGKLLIINILITLVVGAVYFYVQLPAINLQDPGFYAFFFLMAAVYCVLAIYQQGLFRTQNVKELWTGIKRKCLIPFFACALLIIIYLIGSLVSSPVFRAKAYSDLLTIEQGDFAAEVEEISFNQIPMVDSDSAAQLGERTMGELSDMVSQFEISAHYTQINYNGHPVRVATLLYGDLVKWFNNRTEGLPAYIIIDMVTQNAEVVRLDEGMKYTPDEHFGRYLYRYLRFKYPTYMFDTATFEIDEDGTPYWVCPKLVRRIGLFGGTDIEGAVLVNAITGECGYYEEMPMWVDRVYNSSLVTTQYDYYGKYKLGFFNSVLGQRDVTKTTGDHNYIAMNGDVYMYTGVTSVTADNSIVGFILTNQRTKETKYYPISGADEDSAQASAQGVVQHLNYKATFPLLLNISSEPTYFMALKDAAGLVKMYAMVNVSQYQIVGTGNNISECERNYRELLSKNGIVSGDDMADTTVTGVIADIRFAVIEGESKAYIRLEDDDFYYAVMLADSEIAAILNIGDTVTIEISGQDGDIRSAYSVTKK